TGPTVNAKKLTQVRRWTDATHYLTFNIDYNSSGEATKLTVPYGAYFSYTYQSASFSGAAVERREVATRTVNSSATGTTVVEKTDTFSHRDDSSYAAHTQTTLNDAPGNRKMWYFNQELATGWNNGLQTKQEVYQGPSYSLLR